MELFEDRSVRPMLLTERHEPIESDEWLNELKLDGIRCVAYLRRMKGGTLYTVNYALDSGVEVDNLAERWLDLESFD